MNALEIKNLTVNFHLGKETANVVRGIDLTIKAGKTVGLVGESGCGKSVTSLSALRLLDIPPAEVSGSIKLDGQDLLSLPEVKMRDKRGFDIAMIFQEPMTSLNPVFTIGDQITEALMVHENVSDDVAVERAVNALREVGIAGPEEILNRYPHELSGGMKQRVMIAMALICKPRLLIADEPTTALDVTVQAQILDLLRRLQKDHNMSILFITHDLGVVAELAHKVCVMYSGKIVEQAETETLFANPKHPYTKALLESIPKTSGARSKLKAISGMVPNPANLPEGCKFAPRCPLAGDVCRSVEPKLSLKEKNHFAACHMVDDL